MFRRSVKYTGFNDYSTIKKWFYIAIVFVVIAIIWIAYFIFKNLAGNGDIRVNGQVLFNNQPVPSASVSIGAENVVTDENGFYYLSNLDFGRNTIKITKQGYYDKSQSVLLWRKNQRLANISIDRNEDFNASFSGVVLDGFDKKPITGAILTLGSSNVVSNERGEFSFSGLQKGPMKLKISSINYIDLEQEVSIGSANASSEYALTPYGKITFTSNRDGKRNIYSVNYDGKNVRNITAGIKEDCWGGRYTADGKRLVFFSNVGEGLDDWGQKIPALYVLNKNSDTPVKVSRNLIVDGDFRLSRDGARIAFVGKDNETGKSEVYVAGIGDKEEWIQLTDNDVTESNIDISHDGVWVTFGSSADDLQREVRAVNINSLEEKTIFTSPIRESFISFAPDDKSILYSKEGMDFSTRIYVFDLGNNKEKEIYKTSSSVKNIVWSSDSKKLMFTSTRDDRTDIYSLDIDGKNEARITDQSGEYDNLIWPSIDKILTFSIHKEDGYVLAVMDISQRQIKEVEKIGNDILSWDPQAFDMNQDKGL